MSLILLLLFIWREDSIPLAWWRLRWGKTCSLSLFIIIFFFSFMFLLSQFHRLLILLSTLSLFKRWTKLWWKMFLASQHTKKSATLHCEAWARLRKWVTTRKLFTPQTNSTQQPVTNQQHWDWESRTTHSLTGLSLFLLVFLFIVSVVVGAFFSYYFALFWR